MRSRAWPKKLGFGAIVLVVVLTVSEVAARCVWSEKSVRLNEKLSFLIDDPTLLWEMRPDLDLDLDHMHLSTNSLGLRNGEVTVPKPPGTCRVLSLGDSAAWGHGVELEQTFAKVLEQSLERRVARGEGTCRRVEVVNAGVGAYSIWQSMVYLTERGMALQPDLVTFYTLSNDFLPQGVVDRNNFLVDVRYTDRQLYERRRLIAPLLRFAYHSRLYLGIRKQTLRIPKEDKARSRDWRSAGGTRVPAADREIAWNTIAATCQKAGIGVVVVVPMYPMGGPWSSDTLLEKVATQNGWGLVNIPKAFKVASETLPGLWTWADAGHPGPQGHVFIAGQIEDQLVKMGFGGFHP